MSPGVVFEGGGPDVACAAGLFGDMDGEVPDVITIITIYCIFMVQIKW